MHKLARRSVGDLSAWNAEHFQQSGVDKEPRVCCAVSKRYEGDYKRYWYAYHPKWDEFLADRKDGYFVDCCEQEEPERDRPGRAILLACPGCEQFGRSDGSAPCTAEANARTRACESGSWTH